MNCVWGEGVQGKYAYIIPAYLLEITYLEMLPIIKCACSKT